MTKSIIKRAISLSIILFFFAIQYSHAAGIGDAFKTDGTLPLGNVVSNAGYETDNSKVSVELLVGTIIQTLLSLLGVIFVVLMVYGGYNWMTAAGDDAKVTLAKKTITRGIMGIVVVLAAYAISYFVLANLSKNTLKSDYSGAPTIPN
ncbi:hypothetical protein HGA64_01285 [Candidatus Falkowbacteria bacterium]|nr:hypothetical protein [Candidatus Falkowbacteria bacterium]